MSRKKRWSSKQKVEVVLRILRGENIESVSRENNIGMNELIKWRDNFLSAGEKGLQRQQNNDSEILEYQKLLAKTQVELEILKKKHGMKSL